MNRNLDSQTKLTEFAPLSPAEEENAGITYLFSKFFKRSQTPTDEIKESNDPKQSVSGNISANKVNDSLEKKTRDELQADLMLRNNELQGRSLPNVLKRISNLLALKNMGRQSYNDTELKQYWMPDSVSKECYDCGEKFTTFRRRHHCRVCGQIFCSKCCNQEIPGKIMNCTGDLRVCTYCGKVVLSYLESADMRAELSADLRALQDDLQTKFGPAGSLSPNSLLPSSNVDQDKETQARRKTSVGYQEEKFGTIRFEVGRSEEKSSLRGLLEEAVRSGGVLRGSHRFRLRTYHSCFPATQLIDWLIVNNKANNRLQAVALGQAMLDSGYIEGIETEEFSDVGQLLFRVAISVETLSEEENFQYSSQESEYESVCENNHLHQSNSLFNLDLNIEDKTVHVTKPSSNGVSCAAPSREESEAECGLKSVVENYRELERPKSMNWDSVDPESLDHSDKATYFTLQTVYDQHCNSFIRQQLNSEGVSQSWTDVIIPLAKQIVYMIRPDLSRLEDMDIRSYIQLKKVGGGEKQDCSIVSGVCCSKNLAHKAMPSCLTNPRILLLGCAIAYERVEGKLLSLEPIIMQEQDYVGNTVSRICALKPDLILASRNICRLAQEALKAAGVAFALNVKWSTLERLAKVTKADILTSVDAHLGRPQLGTCSKFYLQHFDSCNGMKKTLMVFEGCVNASLGAMVLLRGAPLNELAKIKKVLSSLIFAYYNSKLEISYLMDSHAKPPAHSERLLEESKCDEIVGPTESTEETPNGQVAEESTADNSTCQEGDRARRPTALNSLEPKKQKLDRTLSVCESDTREGEEKSIKCEEICDFSDPLHSYMNRDDSPAPSTPKQILAVAELPLCNKFRKALEDTILSISPYQKLSLPYLESEAGRHCPLRPYFSCKLYWSKQFSDMDVNSRNTSSTHLDLTSSENVKMKEEHELVKLKLTEPAESGRLRSLLANYRACGGRLPPCAPPPALLSSPTEPPPSLDVLDPVNHQRLPVLFSSYSPLSSNAPTFCVDPWVVEMEFYGKFDISLGAFLNRYCFRPEYYCPSESCSVPMLNHTRRFVHQSGALHVNLTSTEPPFNSDSTLMWNWCKICNHVTPVVGMSAGTWALSFAKYLELRFHGGMYTLRSTTKCAHSLHHDCVQYFAYKHTITSFMYNSISMWEICLPPVVLVTEHETFSQDLALEEIKTWTMTGHQIFSVILGKLQAYPPSEGWVVSLKQQLLKDQAYFKSRIESLQIKLTSPTLEENNNKESLIEEVWGIEDCLVLLKRLLAETVDDWNKYLCEAENNIRKKKTSESKTNPIGDIVDGVTETESLDRDSPEPSAEVEEMVEHHKMIPDSDTDVATENEDFDGGYPSSAEIRPSVDKKTVKAILSQLLPTANHNIHIQNPMNETEHHCLPLGFSVPVVVYEREPSSIISYALSCHDYRQAVEALPLPSPLSKRRGSDVTKDTLEIPMSCGDRRSLLSLLRTSSTSSYEKGSSCKGEAFSPNVTSDLDEDQKLPDDAKKNSKSQPSPNIEVQFSDSVANFKVKVYFAEDFARLRSLVLPQGEESFVRSLTRCVAWAASGGKSGSSFSKTKDDRFVLKELSRIETQIFLEIAPQYFTYMETCVRTKSPTLLGKILGVFRITYRNHVGSTTCRSNLLVMEHLFHARQVTDKFDLKGSMRNRLVDTKHMANTQRETVLLDQNLINMTCDSPLYILPHSKAILMQAIHNDTQFLATQSVMDYSLLVGLDRTNNELVVGIIDYIRTFTWDKKLETMVKKYGLLGQGKQPTIISPDEYRDRFIAAMHRYFLAVPDRWTGLGQGLGC